MEAVEKNSMKEFDVRNLFHEKNPKVARWIPGFVFRYLRKITRQDFVNEIIRDYGHLKGHDFSASMMKYFNLTIEVEGEENTYLLAWTTTPWTLPGNLALAVGEDIDYVKIKSGEETYILAADRLNDYKNELDKTKRIEEI